ncbi:MAG TPA: serine/threonine-protein kinase [Fimbriiglobus sp.]|jgi:serine/threonine protein kinase
MSEQEVFQAAVRIADLAARATYLDKACAGDADFRRRVEELLEAHARAGQKLNADLTTSFVKSSSESAEGTELLTPPVNPTQTQDHTPGSIEPDANLSFAATKTFMTPAGTGRKPGRDIGLVVAGRYTLVDVIGEGGMGSVYLAEQSEPVKRKVALKLIKDGKDSTAVLARFDAERQALALMDHPGIARVYDGGKTPTGQPFFVMELVQGVPITTYCDENKLDPKDRLELFVQVCRAVQHAHQKGIIHRDLKPGNILVTTVDGRPTPKVIDFGVAKAVDQRLTDISFIDEGAIVGTPAYMSPEQTDPTVVDIDTRTDVYALGVVLYELLTGLPPISPKEFRRGAILEMLRMVREVEPEHLSTKASSADALPNIAASRGLEPSQLLNFLRGDVDWIVLKALEKDRERRYESANGMATDIMRYLANEPVIARPPSRAYRLRKFVRRNRGAVASAAVVAVALLVGVIGITWQWREAVFQRKQAENNYRMAQEQRKVALDTIGQMITTIRADLSVKPNVQDVVQTLLRIANKNLDNIIQNPAVDISLNDTTRAVIHDYKARTFLGLGDTLSALAEFTKESEIFQAILDQAAEGPDKEVVKKNQVIVMNNLGYATLRTSSQADARKYFDRGVQLADSIRDKSAADYRNIRINLNTNLGIVTIDKNPLEAREYFLRALGLAEELEKNETETQGKPSDSVRNTLLKLNSLIGGTEFRLRHPKNAEDHFVKARALAEDLLKEKSKDTIRKHELASVRERFGDMLLRSNKPVPAAKEYTAAAALFKELADSDTMNVDTQADLARIRYSQGLAAEKTQDKPGATKYFQESLAIRENRPKLETETYAQKDLMVTLAHAGQHGKAVEWAGKVNDYNKKKNDAATFVDIANCYAICSTVVAATNEEKKAYVKNAIDALQLAVDAGYGDIVNLETEPDLDGIRDQDQFKLILTKLKAKLNQ